jgi:aspartyl-tRNA(Asn)/glutamyl-tRNA(Gln) amidotransferase subunit A
MKVRALIKRDFEEAFKRVDVIACPTSPTTAFKLGERTQDPIKMYLADIFTVSINLAELPAISVPIGRLNNLPVGGQLIGRAFDEATLLKLSYLWEEHNKHYQEIPL